MEQKIKKLLVMLSGFGSQKMEEIGVPGFFFVMLVALLCSFFISYLYVHFYSKRATGTQIHRSFPFLGVSITAIFICIQFSLPLSLGLLGALSIVRFRTPIKEPEEIGFIMLVVAASIACATFNFVFLGILLVATVAGCLVLKHGPRVFNRSIDDGVLIVTLPQGEYASKSEKLNSSLDSLLHQSRVESISRNANESVIAYNFKGLKKHTIHELQSELNGLVGDSSYNIYFSRSDVL